jgi:hypothetical protein
MFVLDDKDNIISKDNKKMGFLAETIIGKAKCKKDEATLFSREDFNKHISNDN